MNLSPENCSLSNDQLKILIDFYFHNIVFAKKAGMENDKISGYFSIMRDVHERGMDPDVTLIDSFTYFKKLLVKHSVHRPPFSIELFSLEDVKKLSSYTHSTYYRHFKMYQYAFCKKQKATFESFSQRQLNELPFVTLPLVDAKSEEELAQIAEEEQKRVESAGAKKSARK